MCVRKWIKANRAGYRVCLAVVVICIGFAWPWILNMLHPFEVLDLVEFSVSESGYTLKSRVSELDIVESETRHPDGDINWKVAIAPMTSTPGVFMLGDTDGNSQPDAAIINALWKLGEIEQSKFEYLQLPPFDPGGRPKSVRISMGDASSPLRTWTYEDIDLDGKLDRRFLRYNGNTERIEIYFANSWISVENVPSETGEFYRELGGDRREFEWSDTGYWMTKSAAVQ